MSVINKLVCIRLARLSLVSGFAFLLLLLGAQSVFAQLEFEMEPINYHSDPTNDPIAKLQERIDSGETKLKFDNSHGYLPAVLEALNVPVSSQMLVFSKTSFQLRRIMPTRPRAVYFGDDMYVGWVQYGDVVEISAQDPKQGAIFYTLEQAEKVKPKFVRDRGQCTTCHASSRTQGVPGHLIRSVYSDPGGRPLLGSGTYVTDHRSPFENRWGGWYVSGTHGEMRHMGNAIALDKDRPEYLDREAGANVFEINNIVNTRPYLSPHSDIVALMVMEHQSQMHNYITLAGFEARSALHYDRIMNNALERDVDYQSDTTLRRLDKVSEKLLRYMLFVDEFALTSPVEGASNFKEDFSAKGIRDEQDRSLRDFDLKTRLFKYPCSYLIHSEQFLSLPYEIKQRVYSRLDEVLSGADQSPEFSHLSLGDRQAVSSLLKSAWSKNGHGPKTL